MQPQRYLTSSSSSSSSNLGLEALTLCPKKNQTEEHCNSCMMTSSSSLASCSSASSLNSIGDYIGMESCFDLDIADIGNSSNINNVEVCDGGGGGGGDDYYSSGSGVCSQSRVKREQRASCRKRMMTKREFPPPLPSLIARTSENQSSRQPWVLKRYYTNDGRLILREEKVKHHEYFRAHRSNGRLTLHLVPYDDIDDDQNDDDHDEEAKEYLEEAVSDDDSDNNIKINNNAEDDHTSNIVETLLRENISSAIEDSMVKSFKSSIADTISNPIDKNGIAGKGVMCLNYSSVRASPTCFLGLPVPAMRPVHT